MAEGTEVPRPVTTLDRQDFSTPQIVLLLGLVVSVLTIVGFFMKLGRDLRADREALEQKRQNDLDLREANARREAEEREDRAASALERLTVETAKHNESIETRLTKQETRSADFMPRSEIEAKFDHMRTNLTNASQVAREGIEQARNAITGIMVAMGKLEQQQAGTASDVGEIKTILKDQARDMNGRLDKMADSLNQLTRRTPAA